MGSKDKKKHREKDKKERHEKISKKEKKASKEKKRSKRRDSSGSSSSDSQGVGDVNTQLAKSRAAARATREILAYDYQLRTELRELVRQLDAGGALDVSGIPDDFLRAKLCTLFDNLIQLKKNSAGQYFKRREMAPVLSFIAPLLEETPASLAAYAPKPASKAPVAAGTAPSPSAAAAQPNSAAAGLAGESREQQQQHGMEEGPDEAAGAEAGSSEGPLGSAAPIGPQAGPPVAAATANQSLQEGLVGSEGEEEHYEEGGRPVPADRDDGDAAEAAGAGRRVLGPSVPTQQQLAEAAQMEYPQEDYREGMVVEEEEELLVGPPPPELEAEMDAASMDERSAEVVRIVRALQKHVAALAGATSAQAAEQPIDPYEVLGVEEEATAGEVKKKYWRLSLLIHPDKCEHPQAQEAFQAVARAAKELQDTGQRGAALERRQERQLRAEFEAEAAVQERARQWRIMRGEATAEDLAGPAAAQFGGPERDTWMTELPPERKAAGVLPTMTNQIGFSKAGIKERGDTSAWTLTPAQRALQLEGGGAQQGPMLLTAAVEGASQQRLERTAAAIDQYNSQRRKKSLLEQHMEKQEPAKKRKKDKGAAKAAPAEQEWDPTQHPWRPFDREKDLGAGLKGPASAQDMLKNAKALTSKFSGGQGSTQRTFL